MVRRKFKVKPMKQPFKFSLKKSHDIMVIGGKSKKIRTWNVIRKLGEKQKIVARFDKKEWANQWAKKRGFKIKR